VFDEDDVVGGLVTLEARVRVAAEPDEAVLAAEYQLGPVDDGHVEAFAVRADGVGDGVEAAVHPGRDVATVGGAQSYRPVGQPVDAEQARRRPVPRRSHKVNVKLRMARPRRNTGGGGGAHLPGLGCCTIIIIIIISVYLSS